ncbi:MAG TPA: hypothetical protein VM054_05280 [bacterium]|nr:hypothetical protein [bacterium]
MLEPWQKKAVFRRAFLSASRLTLLVVLLGTAVIFSLVLAWFWPSVGLLAIAVIGYVVWSAATTGRPVHIARSVLRELSGFSGLSHRFRSRLAVIERVFVNFWEKTETLDEELIGEARREALRALIALSSRLRAVGLADRVNRDARRIGKTSDRAEEMVAAALDEVERFAEMLNQTAVTAAEVLLLSREEASERMTRAAEELALWGKSLAEAKVELDESGL